MSITGVGLCGAVALAVLLLRDVLTEMCQEEIRTRLSRLPAVVLRLVALRSPRDTREDLLGEWRAELEFILQATEGMPLTRLLRGLGYSLGLLRMMLPIHQISERFEMRQPGPASWRRSYLRQAAAADAISGLAGGLLGFEVRFTNNARAGETFIFLAVALAVMWPAVMGLSGAYDPREVGRGIGEFKGIINAAVLVFASVACFAFYSGLRFEKNYVILVVPSIALIDLMARVALRKRLHRLRIHGVCMQRVVVVGHADLVADLSAQLRRETYHGLQVVAACVVGNSRQVEIDTIPVIAGLDRVADVVNRYEADTVAVLACPEMSGAALRELAWELEKTGTELCAAPALLDVTGPRTTIRPIAGLPLMHIDHPDLSGLRRITKAAFDRTVAATALLALSPLMLFLMTVIRLGDGGSAFIRQTRIGCDGRVFSLLKFRTVAVDSENREARFVAFSESDGVLFKMCGGPRVTAVGAWLRRWSLDDLPQLINVLIGDMSLIGPRPALPQEAALYGDQVRRRLTVKPGITGLWQVSGRSDLSWDESVRLDLRYVNYWSFTLDLQILWKTWSAVFRGSSAY